MVNGIIISDSGPIISLAIVEKLGILTNLFDDIYVPQAVWEELTKDNTTPYHQPSADFLQNRVRAISTENELTSVMDYGESEAVILYKELNADYLLIDDKKAREIAEELGLQCIGTIGILAVAKEKGLIQQLRPLFLSFIEHNRFYSIRLLNTILEKYGEPQLP